MSLNSATKICLLKCWIFLSHSFHISGVYSSNWPMIGLKHWLVDEKQTDSKRSTIQKVVSKLFYQENKIILVLITDHHRLLKRVLLHICARVQGKNATAGLWRTKDNLVAVVLSFHLYMASGMKIRSPDMHSNSFLYWGASMAPSTCGLSFIFFSPHFK